ncbi:MAG: polyphosphate kinase 2 family protein [Euryarchaeota archaeon]|nr:polyphosphate kinase 2 family protein [Euryarchaeota archaeon]MDE1836850.1 polyphosphate kinase 2 family protein [Euryarchaeota archaeon]MDE1879729.1 polyphosphate kinase 2 family protein [Euryarchaeota archaeon]MDE2046048.1 polyphosphate kinase 2 family protein [Thermoplasmata archaeon]
MKGPRAPAHGKVHLDQIDPSDTSTFDGKKEQAEAELERLRGELDRLQELLYADHRRAVLIVLQGMDTAGKDGVIRHVFEGVNPQGVEVASFKAPSSTELEHDFLWRVHLHTPPKGHMAIFNRSHYEDVLAVRVHHLVPKEVWEERYRAINEFERELDREGTLVLKFFLHISKEEQKRRLEARLEDPTKHWKFSPSDLHERQFWSDYQSAYEELLELTSSQWAPWYVIPSDHKWFRNWCVSKVLVGALEEMHLKYPKGPEHPSSIKVP